jgi:hypothetical protein
VVFRRVTLPRWLLDLTFEVDGLAGTVMQSGLLPASASRDAVHIAVTAVHQVHFLLTWNCRHIANATIFRDLQHIIMSAGYDVPVICTPGIRVKRDIVWYQPVSAVA